MLSVAGALYTVKRDNGKQWTEKSLVDEARVVQECFQFSPKSDERRCGSDDWWKTVLSPWGSHRK